MAIWGLIPKESELQQYLKSLLMVLPGKEANKSFDVLEWWKANKAEYPTLFHIAVELFAIPGMSAEVERIFSGYFFCFISNWRRQSETNDYWSKKPIRDRCSGGYWVFASLVGIRNCSWYVCGISYWWIDDYWWLKRKDVSKQKWGRDNFVNDIDCDFRVFDNLSLVVCSIAIKIIKNRWITCDFDKWWWLLMTVDFWGFWGCWSRMIMC